MYIFTKFSWLKYNCQAVVEKEKKNQIMLRRRIDNIHSVFFTRITRYVENVWLSHADVYYLIFSIFSVICVLLTISWTLQKKKKWEIISESIRRTVGCLWHWNSLFLTTSTRPQYAGFWIHLDLSLYHRFAKNPANWSQNPRQKLNTRCLQSGDSRGDSSHSGDGNHFLPCPLASTSCSSSYPALPAQAQSASPQ